MKGLSTLKEPRNRSRKIALVAAFLMLSSLAGVFSGRFSELWQDDRPLQEKIPRIVFWQVHWSMFKDHPYLGVGYVNRNAEKLDYYQRAGYTNISRKYSAHNIYLQTAADSGVVGLLGLLSLLASGLVVAIRAWRQGDARLLYFMLGVCLAGLMQNTFRDSEFVFAYWVGFALILTGKPSWKTNQKFPILSASSA